MDLILQRIAADANTLVPALYTLLVAAALDLATGLAAAALSGTLQWTFVSEFVRGHLLQKIAPIMLSLVGGVAVGGVDTIAGAGLLAAGVAGGIAYLTSSIASIGSNVKAGAAKTKGLPSSATPLSATITSTELEPLADRFEGDRFAEPDTDERGDEPQLAAPAPAIRKPRAARKPPVRKARRTR